MADKPTAVFDVGMLTAVGMNAEQTAASVRAGISRFAETSVYDKRFEPFVMALLPDEVLPPLASELEKAAGLTSRQMRILRLAAPALRQVATKLANTADIPIYLGAPEQFPNRPQPLNDEFFNQLSIQSGIQFNITESKLFCDGRAAGLIALKEAMERISSGKNNSVLAGGADTYLDLYLLGTLDTEARILGPGTMDGFIPGEGAAFLLLSKSDTMTSHNISPLASLSSVSIGYEEGHLYSEKPYLGDGLASTLEKLFQNGNIKETIKEVYSSINGENHWAKEWGVAFLRNSNFFDAAHGMHHPADCFGDTGAASGIILVILAIMGIKHGYRRRPALITCSSDFGNRAAVTVISL